MEPRAFFLLSRAICRKHHVGFYEAPRATLLSSRRSYPWFHQSRTTTQQNRLKLRRPPPQRPDPPVEHSIQTQAAIPRKPAKDPDLQGVRVAFERIFNSHDVPTEQEVLDAMKLAETAACDVAGIDESRWQPFNEEKSPASALLSLVFQPEQLSEQTWKHTIDFISNAAHKLLLHPHVFITLPILDIYTRTQALLGQSNYFAEAFAMYANKPVPKQSSREPHLVTFEPAKPLSLSMAVPSRTANLALQTAIHTHSLEDALAIIDSTYGARVFRRNKFFRIALPPLMALSLAPVAIYTLALQLSNYQTMLSHGEFATITSVGTLTYIAAVGTIGYVAMTTANDQMRRMTWAKGMPLHERWLREEERSAADQVALAWGFREKWRWGEEEGAEWEEIKRWAGIRGMVLDSVELLEGME